jgi:hypothetical protein
VVAGGKPPGDIEAALLAQIDVDEDDIGAERAGEPECLGARRRDADDARSPALQQVARRLEEVNVVVNDEEAQRRDLLLRVFPTRVFAP